MRTEEYEKSPALSYSAAKELARSPRHYLEWLNAPEEEETPALRLGRLVHLCTLQPKVFDETIRIAPKCDRRFKEGKEIYAAFQSSLQPGQEAITESEGEAVTSISTAAKEGIDALLKHYEGKDCQFEVPVFSPYRNVNIKGMPDLVFTAGTGEKIVVDVKTCADASPKAFLKDIANFKYYLQAVWYMQLTGATQFVFLAVEKTAPHEYSFIQLDKESLDQAKAMMDGLCDLYGNCTLFKKYPGYSKTVHTLPLPKWAFMAD